MFEKSLDAGRRVVPFAASLGALACAMLACTAPARAQFAQDDSGQAKTDTAKTDTAKPPKVSRAKPPSSNATVNLINLLVKQGVLKEEQANALIKQAEDEAYIARQAAKDATSKADDASKAATAAAAAANPPGTKHVTYVPEIVKRELREEIRQEVMAKAEKENWASPGKYPEWAQRIHFYGDFRARYEGDFFPKGNDQAGAANFNAVNTGAPFLDCKDCSPYFGPTYNDTQDRDRIRLRARLGMDADLLNGFTAGLRIATGENSSPVSTNQTFGNSGGNFSKYALWLDRAFLKYQHWNGDVAISVGRFDNPFWSPTDLVWYNELGFDGVAIQAKHEFWEGFVPFAVAGAFPIYNTDFNAGINLPADPNDPNSPPTKVPTHDKWLLGVQGGFAARFSPDYAFTFAAAFYNFTDVQGLLSSPCIVVSSADICDTDYLRPTFAQKGNTYMRLRNIIPALPPDLPDSNDYQYFGLASQFRPLVVSARADFGLFAPVHVIVDGEYVWNTAFNKAAMEAVAVNNRGPDLVPGEVPGPYEGGGIGWLARLTVGSPVVKQLGDWNVHVGYKYLESDATIDAFVDSDFGLGGTNLKGYFIGGNVGLSENVWTTIRYMSAKNIAGSPYAVDIVQVDLNAKF